MKRDIFLLVLCHNFSLKYTTNYTSNLTKTAPLCVTIGHIILRSFEVQQLQLQLPELCSMRGGCDSFWFFFKEKIDKLLINLHCTTAVDLVPAESCCLTASIQAFEITTRAKMSYILGTTNKTGILHPLRSAQLSDNVESMVPVITYTTNTSLENTVMSLLLKHAIVRPLRKKQALNKEMLNNIQLAT